MSTVSELPAPHRPVEADPWQRTDLIRFGQRPSQVMPADWAERILTKLAKDRGKQFGELLAAAALGED